MPSAAPCILRLENHFYIPDVSVLEASPRNFRNALCAVPARRSSDRSSGFSSKRGCAITSSNPPWPRT